MKVLDLFCGEGGAGYGYHLAGFEVFGVDRDPEALSRYPFPHYQGDALKYLEDHGQEYDLVHLSPPCQAYSTMTYDPSRHPKLIAPAQQIVDRLGVPYILENVEGARWDMHLPRTLCGSSFGLKVRRHRLFESNLVLTDLPCRHKEQGKAIGVYGSPEKRQYYRPDGTVRNRKASGVEEARELMGMPWASWHGCCEAIPPVYTEFLGKQAMAQLTTP